MELKYEFLTDTLEERWQVIFEQAQASGYQIGLYKPEFNSATEVTSLEMHSGPEIFLLTKGEMLLIIRDIQGNPESEEIIKLSPGKPIVVFGYHNGYTPNNGVAFVVEENALQTDIIQRK